MTLKRQTKRALVCIAVICLLFDVCNGGDGGDQNNQENPEPGDQTDSTNVGNQEPSDETDSTNLGHEETGDETDFTNLVNQEPGDETDSRNLGPLSVLTDSQRVLNDEIVIVASLTVTTEAEYNGISSPGICENTIECPFAYTFREKVGIALKKTFGSAFSSVSVTEVRKVNVTKRLIRYNVEFVEGYNAPPNATDQVRLTFQKAVTESKNSPITVNQLDISKGKNPKLNRTVVFNVKIDMEFDPEFLDRNSPAYQDLSSLVSKTMERQLSKTTAIINIDNLNVLGVSKGSVIVSLRVDYHLERGEDDPVVTNRLRAAFQNIITYETFQGHPFYSDFLHMSSPVLVINSTYGPDHGNDMFGKSKESTHIDKDKEHNIGKDGLVIIGCGSAFVAIFFFVLFWKMWRPTKKNAEKVEKIEDTVSRNKPPKGSHKWTSPSNIVP